VSCQPQPAAAGPQWGPSSEEAALLARVRAGETEAFYALVEPSERTLYLAAYAILQNEADAEEVAQESVLKAFSKLDQFRGESKFSTWLVRIAINEARIRVRRNRLRAAQPVEAPLCEDQEREYTPLFLADWREIPSDTLEREEVRTILMNALNALPRAYREVVMLRDVQQLSTAETAEVLGISKSSVKTRLLRARLHLRDVVVRVLGNHYSGDWQQRGKKPWAW
jgi:RNA polymerase sigma-70 factor (ECF subfamily)